jgi:NADPH:quinone reductase-like Zn-dependent oxidoreductase
MVSPSSLLDRIRRAWLMLKHPTLRRRNQAYFKVWLGRLVLWGGAVGVGMLAVGFAHLSDLAIHHLSVRRRQNIRGGPSC